MATKISSSKIKATGEVYPELVLAYEHFNVRLFAEMLPPCLITLARGKNTLGYFSPGRFVRHDLQLTHELALHPGYFASRPLKDTLSTIAHELVHLWQFSFGTPSRGGYHNAEFAAMMTAIGLMASTTGMPGGAKVGEKMDHYIIEGGLFDRACDELIADGFHLSWFDRFPVEVPVGMDLPPDYRPPRLEDLGKLPAPQLSGDEIATAIKEAFHAGATVSVAPCPPARLPEPALTAISSALSWPCDQRKPGTRTKFRCSGCGGQAWAKASMDFQCNHCDRPMLPVGQTQRSRISPKVRVAS